MSGLCISYCIKVYYNDIELYLNTDDNDVGWLVGGLTALLAQKRPYHASKGYL